MTYYVVVAETVLYGFEVELDNGGDPTHVGPSLLTPGQMTRAKDIAVQRLAEVPPEERVHNFGAESRRAIVVSADPGLFASYQQSSVKDIP